MRREGGKIRLGGMRSRAPQGADDARQRLGKMYVPPVIEGVCVVLLLDLTFREKQGSVEDGSNEMMGRQRRKGRGDEPRPRSTGRRMLCAR